MNLFQEIHEFEDESDKKIKELNFLINKFQNVVSKKKTNSRTSNISLSSDLTKILEISDTEYAIFLGCLAIELDSKYEKIYAYLQDDITKKRPTLNLISRIIGLNFVNKIQNFYAVGATSILFRAHLIEFVDESIGLMSRPLKINDSLISFVFNPDNQVQIPAHLKNSIRLFPTSEQEKTDTEILESDSSSFIQLDQVENLKLEILACLNNGLANNDRFAILLFGKNNSGRKTIIKSLVSKIEYYQHMLIFDIKKHFLYNNIPAIESSCNFINLVSLLNDSFVYVDGLDHLLNEQFKPEMDKVVLLNNLFYHLFEKEKLKKNLIVFSLNKSNIENVSELENLLYKKNIDFVKIKVPDLGIEEKTKIWEFFLDQNKIGLDQQDILRVSSTYDLTIGQMKKVIRDLMNSYPVRSQNVDESFSTQDLYTACRNESNKKLMNVAKKLSKKFNLDDIILPPETKNQLVEIINYVENQNQVFSTWGFEDKMGLSKSINILFTGESGTGKTMAAQILANHLNMDIYRIDLSMLISKYIGETEKNINKIFEEAKSSNSIIFFDEADACFGKRTEIRDSHDRYSNIEVDYLLQRLEEHDEIVILASNLKQNIDEAFTRRMQFIVNFSFPTEKERIDIWKNVFPMPYSYIDIKNCDFEFLAKNFRTSGAMIKNIALTAAFLALSDGDESSIDQRKISMRHIILALKKELEKKGTPVLKSDFGIYFEDL